MAFWGIVCAYRGNDLIRLIAVDYERLADWGNWSPAGCRVDFW